MRIRSCGPVPVVKQRGRDVTGNRATVKVETRALTTHYPPIRPQCQMLGVQLRFIEMGPTHIKVLARERERNEREITGTWSLHKDQMTAYLKVRK